MKKIFTILSVAFVAMVAFSCAKDQKTVFKASETTAPVLTNISVGTDIAVGYTPAVFNMSFNQKMETYHTLALVELNGEAVNQSLTAAKNDSENGKLTLTGVNFTKAMQARGYEIGAVVTVKFAVRASIQDPAKGITNGYVDSAPSEAYEFTLAEEKGGDPYAGWEASDWGAIGSIASAGISWDKDIPMVTDGTWHVAKGVVLTTSDEFKFRKDGAWTVNFGGEFTALDAEFAVTQDGANIKVTEDGTYDLLLNPSAGVAKIIVTGSNADPYAAFEETKVWGVIGSIASTGNSWNADEPMLTNGTWYVCRGLEIVSTDEFKFRKDAGWTVNFGGAFAEVGAEFTVTQDGANITGVPDGKYDVLLNPDAAVAKIVKYGEDPEL